MNENIPQVPLDTKELELIVGNFKENDALLLAMRAVMLNLNPTKSDKELVSKTFASDELFAVVSYRFLPEAKRETPIGQIQDIWLGAESMIFGAHEGQIKQAVEYKDQSIMMTRMALDLLRDPERAKVDVAYSPKTTTDPLQIGLLARNQFMRHVEQQLLFLKLVAEQQGKDEGEKKKVQTKNRAK